MTHDKSPRDEGEQRRDDLLRRALSTPPISNEDIVKKSKESKGKWGKRGPLP